MASGSVRVEGPDGPDFGRMSTGIMDDRRRLLTRAAILVHKDARRNAPVSPTQRDLNRGMTGKRRPGARKANATSRPNPGGLIRSIDYRVTEDDAEVFVSANSEAAKYAKKIHDEKGVTWFNRGPGTVMRGPQADELFILRAVQSNRQTVLDLIRGELDRRLRP